MSIAKKSRKNRFNGLLIYKLIIDHLQGVPYHWAHFVFAIFSASGACTEELFIAIG